MLIHMPDFKSVRNFCVRSDDVERRRRQVVFGVSSGFGIC